MFAASSAEPSVSKETQQRIANLLGYPAAGPRIRAIFDGRLAWAKGATEADWIEVIRRAETKSPERNAVDGSVKEGWLRSVLVSVRGKAATT